jgi:hypothetical protein
LAAERLTAPLPSAVSFLRSLWNHAMMTRRFAWALSFAALFYWARPASAQHLDILSQDVGGKLTTGTTDFIPDPPVTTLNIRAFSRFLSSGFVANDPGFNSIGSSSGTIPAGSGALPGGADLSWDFLPMKVDGVASDLLYWNGVGSQPAFGLPPSADYTLSLFGKNDARFAAGETPQLITGGVIATTAADGFIHQHRFFFLDNDHDDNNATVAANGVYLVSLRLRLPGLDRSDPIYIAFGTPSVSNASLSAAASWVQGRQDQLAPNFSADFDGDLDVDGADFLRLQRGLGKVDARQINGDADGSRTVDGDDLAAWRSQWGLSLATFGGVAASSLGALPVPEPDSAAIAATGVILLGLFCRRSWRCCAVRP